MKKAKIFLSAFAVLALVAGALAFKASKGSTIFCTTTTGHTAGTTACPASFFSTYDVTTGTQDKFCTVTDNTTCAQKAINIKAN
jgi:hypothetical protein